MAGRANGAGETAGESSVRDGLPAVRDVNGRLEKVAGPQPADKLRPWKDGDALDLTGSRFIGDKNAMAELPRMFVNCKSPNVLAILQ